MKLLQLSNKVRFLTFRLIKNKVNKKSSLNLMNQRGDLRLGNFLFTLPVILMIRKGVNITLNDILLKVYNKQ